MLHRQRSVLDFGCNAQNGSLDGLESVRILPLGLARLLIDPRKCSAFLLRYYEPIPLVLP